jgi:hypothetical protein
MFAAPDLSAIARIREVMANLFAGKKAHDHSPLGKTAVTGYFAEPDRSF